MKSKTKLHIGSKWTKTLALLADRHVRDYVPETRRMNAASLRVMLARYAMVYAKPVSGTYGNGVMRVARIRGRGGARYSCQLQTVKRTFASFDALYRHIGRLSGSRPYLVQRGIRLLRHGGRLFDIRVMVQRNRAGKWVTTGIIGRVARADKIVTNYHSGGQPIDVAPLLRPYMAKPQDYERKLAAIGIASTLALSRKFPRVNMIGADIGVDTGLRPWIIELNTSPDPYIFRHSRDKAMARRVLAYARALGRIPPKRRPR